MWSDLLTQITLILIMLMLFLFMYNIPQKRFTKQQFWRHGSKLQAKKHFIQGAQLLTQARSTKDQSTAFSLAKSAELRADKAIALDPKDAVAHILKALALEFQGFKTSALETYEAALSPLAIKSLSDLERGDALLKRAELKLEVNPNEQVDSVVQDLVESVRLKDNNPRAFCLLGECYEKKGSREEAIKAYANALRVQPLDNVAC